MPEDTIKSSNYNLDEFRENSEVFYNKIKEDLESKYFGKYAAINYEIENYEIGDTITDALTKARSKYPGKLFYVIQVGTGTTFRIQSFIKSNVNLKKAKKLYS